MSEKRDLGYDPVARVREMFHREGDRGEYGVHRTQDVEPVLEYAKQVRDRQEGQRWGDGRHVATIPNIIVERMMRSPHLFPNDELAGILDANYKVLDERRWKRWLNDPDNRLFRTFGGEV